jgi:hypothetical protein
MLRGKILVGLLFCIATLGASFPYGTAQDDGPVSLIQLIANPEKYDGKQVQVIGFLRLEFEGNALYLHEDDYKNVVFGNSIGLGIPKKQKLPEDELNMHYVKVVGTFKAGMSNIQSGVIIDITTIERWPPQWFEKTR